MSTNIYDLYAANLTVTNSYHVEIDPVSIGVHAGQFNQAS